MYFTDKEESGTTNNYLEEESGRMKIHSGIEIGEKRV